MDGIVLTNRAGQWAMNCATVAAVDDPAALGSAHAPHEAFAMSDTNPILTDPSNIGLAALQAQFPTLDGAGVTVGQAEADITGNEFEVDPAMLGANVDPTNSNGFLTYYGDDDGVLASTTIYDDGVIGSFSGHATAVAQQFYGADGVAPGVAHVDMYNAEDYPGTFLAADKVVNMS